MKRTDQIINELVSDENFISILEEMTNKNLQRYLKSHKNLLSKTPIHENQLMKQFGQMVCLTVEDKLSKVLDQEFVDVERQVDILKEEMFTFIQEQANLTCDMRKDLNKGLEQIRRKTTTEKVISNIPPTRGTSVKLMRTNLKSAIEKSQKQGLSQQVMQIRKEIQLIHQFLDKQNSTTTISERLSEFQIEAKVGIQGIRHEIKKLKADISKKGDSKNKSLSPAMKETITETVKRGIKSQLNVYNDYTEQIIDMRSWVQKLQEHLQGQQTKNQDYLSTQLKSLWLVLNGVKTNVDKLMENAGFQNEEII